MRYDNDVISLSVDEGLEHRKSYIITLCSGTRTNLDDIVCLKNRTDVARVRVNDVIEQASEQTC